MRPPLHPPFFDGERWLKECAGCRVPKELSEFPPEKNSASAEGALSSKCRDCRRARQQKYLAANRGKSRAWGKASRARRPDEAIERRREYQRSYSADRRRNMTPEDKAKANKTVRERDSMVRADPALNAKRIETHARSRARRLGASRVDRVDRMAIIERDNATCYLWCGRRLRAFQVQLDHVVPLSRGGNHTEDNLRVACKQCNARKANRLLSEIPELSHLHVPPAT